MQKIMISVHPEWCEKIAPRLKTVEVRKNEPQCKLPFKCYIYETKGGAKKYYDVFHKNTVGKVVGEFVCDRIMLMCQSLQSSRMDKFVLITIQMQKGFTMLER